MIIGILIGLAIGLALLALFVYVVNNWFSSF